MFSCILIFFFSWVCMQNIGIVVLAHSTVRGKRYTEPEFVNLQRSPGIDSQPGGTVSLESIPGSLNKVGLCPS